MPDTIAALREAGMRVWVCHASPSSLPSLALPFLAGVFACLGFSDRCPCSCFAGILLLTLLHHSA